MSIRNQINRGPAVSSKNPATQVRDRRKGFAQPQFRDVDDRPRHTPGSPQFPPRRGRVGLGYDFRPTPRAHMPVCSGIFSVRAPCPVAAAIGRHREQIGANRFLLISAINTELVLTRRFGNRTSLVGIVKVRRRWLRVPTDSHAGMLANIQIVRTRHSFVMPTPDAWRNPSHPPARRCRVTSTTLRDVFGTTRWRRVS